MTKSQSFEVEVLTAAEFAKAKGFTHTYLALLEVLRQHRKAVKAENHSSVGLH